MIRVLFSIPVLLASLCLATAANAGVNESGFSSSPFYSAQVQGDFTANSVAVLRNGAGPFLNTISDLPLGATVIKAYANYITLTQNPGDASEKSLAINGNSVTASLLGSGSLTGLISDSVASYLADVTPFVTGNNNYAFSFGINSPANTDNNKPLIEGLSLLVVYSTNTGPLRQVDLFGGLTHPLGGLPAGATLNFSSPYTGGPMKFFIDAADGQVELTDQFTLNGSFPALPGLSSSGNSFIGAFGPSWDQALGDISAMVPLNASSLQFSTGGFQGTGTDYVAHGMTAVSFTIVPEPSSISLLSLAALMAARRRRR